MAKKKKVLNLTRHEATPEQKRDGVVEPDEKMKAMIRSLLTFTRMPDAYILNLRAKSLAYIAQRLNFKRAMIGGAPYLMSFLERELLVRGIEVLYSFYQRKQMEETYEGLFNPFL